MAVEQDETIYEPLSVPRKPENLERFPAGHAVPPERQGMFDEVLSHFDRDNYVLPSAKEGSLRDEEKFWLSYECIHRYLRATKWASAKAAIKRLEETLAWRREYGVYDLISAEHVEPEALTGKMVLFGYDADGRPALYLRPSRQNTDESIRQMQFLTWMLERSVDLMGPGIENVAIMVDVAEKAKMPSISTSRQFINILQGHYPERLGRALIINVPFLMNAFFRIITPFLDPVTREKMRFNPACVKDGLFTPDMLMKEWGGACTFAYEHERYWPALVRMCEERRGRMMEAWRGLGAKVGLKEWDVKCAIDAEGPNSMNENEVEAGEAEESSQVNDPVGEVAVC